MPRRRRSRAELEAIIAAQVNAEIDEALKDHPLLLRSGEGNQIEEDAERLLAATRRQARVTQDDPGDYLSREQYILRKTREIYNTLGVPDASLISGMYKKAYNPEFGRRPNSSQKSEE